MLKTLKGLLLNWETPSKMGQQKCFFGALRKEKMVKILGYFIFVVAGGKKNSYIVGK